MEKCLSAQNLKKISSKNQNPNLQHLTKNQKLSPVHVFTSLLPPANEVCEGYVFTGVCLSTGGCLPHTPLGRNPRGQTPPVGRHLRADTPLADTPPPGGYYGIRSRSGRYASHCNAFLLI